MQQRSWDIGGFHIAVGGLEYLARSAQLLGFHRCRQTSFRESVMRRTSMGRMPKCRPKCFVNGWDAHIRHGSLLCDRTFLIAAAMPGRALCAAEAVVEGMGSSNTALKASLVIVDFRHAHRAGPTC